MAISNDEVEKRLQKLQKTIRNLSVEAQLVGLELADILEDIHSYPLQTSFLDSDGNVKEHLGDY